MGGSDNSGLWDTSIVWPKYHMIGGNKAMVEHVTGLWTMERALVTGLLGQGDRRDRRNRRQGDPLCGNRSDGDACRQLSYSPTNRLMIQLSLGNPPGLSSGTVRTSLPQTDETRQCVALRQGVTANPGGTPGGTLTEDKWSFLILTSRNEVEEKLCCEISMDHKVGTFSKIISLVQ